MRSWRTTVFGVLVIVQAVSAAAVAMLDGKADTAPDMMALAAAVTAGIGLIVAKDGRVGGQGQVKP